MLRRPCAGAGERRGWLGALKRDFGQRWNRVAGVYIYIYIMSD